METQKLDSTIRHLLGLQYVTRLIKEKYNIDIDEVLLESQRKVVLKSTKYLIKTRNGINCYRELENYRKVTTNKYPVCHKE